VAFEPDSAGQKWLQDQWLEIVERHSLQWVAANGDGIVAYGELLDEVGAQVDELHAIWDDIAFAFVDGQEFEPNVYAIYELNETR
jgi:hypothetical protein